MHAIHPCARSISAGHTDQRRVSVHSFDSPRLERIGSSSQRRTAMVWNRPRTAIHRRTGCRIGRDRRNVVDVESFRFNVDDEQGPAVRGNVDIADAGVANEREGRRIVTRVSYRGGIDVAGADGAIPELRAGVFQAE